MHAAAAIKKKRIYLNVCILIAKLQNNLRIHKLTLPIDLERLGGAA
jgi:hypothetical protein